MVKLSLLTVGKCADQLPSEEQTPGEDEGRRRAKSSNPTTLTQYSQLSCFETSETQGLPLQALNLHLSGIRPGPRHFLEVLRGAWAENYWPNQTTDE